MPNILYIEKIPTGEQLQFTIRLNQIAIALGIKNANWLMQVFHAESRVNPKAYNGATGATGLIQFMPATAKGLGTTTAYLKTLTATQQLDWVYKYFLPYKGRLNSYFDVYLVVFFPAAIGKADTWIMQTSKLSPEIIAKQNPAINIIKDGKITVAEFKQYLIYTVPKSFRDFVFSAPVIATATTAILLTGIFFFY